MENLKTLHQNKIKKFENYEKKLNDIQKKINEIENKNEKNDNDLKYLKTLILEKKKINNDNDELEYFLDCGNLISNYFNSKIEIYSDDSSESDDNFDFLSNNNNNNNNNDILSFFKSNKQNYEEKKNKRVPKSKQLKNIYDDYINILNENQSSKNINDIMICDCGNMFKIDTSKGLLICKKCGLTQPILVEINKSSNREQNTDSVAAAYKRKNHLNELLNQLQAKETTEIPNEVYDKIMQEINKNNIDIKTLNGKITKKILKKLNYQKYYEHIPHILYKLIDKKPLTIPRHIENKIKKLFEETEEPFQRNCPPSRKNFLSYLYVLHKICELLELNEYLEYFSLLKNQKILCCQDNLWKLICNDLGWRFIPSI